MGAPPFDCVAGGLAIDLNGTWTLTGTTMSDPFFTNMWTSMAITMPVMMRREGSGRCVFGLSSSGEPVLDQRWYIDDTFAAFYQPAYGARDPEWKQFLCVRPSDQALYYQSSIVGFQMQHQYATKTDGVLTR